MAGSAGRNRGAGELDNACVTGHAELRAGFRAAVEKPTGPLNDMVELVSSFTGQEPREEPAEPWVLPELVALIDHLCLDRVPAERAAYGQELYATVRETLRAPAAGTVARR